MTNEVKEVLKCAKVIQEYCEGRECDEPTECPFLNIHEEIPCEFRKSVPQGWRLKERDEE